MDNEKKRDFQLRITNANNVELIIILYEIAVEYLECARASYEAGDRSEFKRNSESARNCIEEMVNSLDFGYEITPALHKLYLFMKKEIRDAVCDDDIAPIDDVIGRLKTLKSAYEQIKDEDTSAPVMKHIQTIITGMTYGKNKILNDITQDCSNRGFRV